MQRKFNTIPDFLCFELSVKYNNQMEYTTLKCGNAVFGKPEII